MESDIEKIIDNKVENLWNRLKPELKERIMINISNEESPTNFNSWGQVHAMTPKSVITIWKKSVVRIMKEAIEDNLRELIIHEISHVLGITEGQMPEHENKPQFFYPDENN